MIIAQITDTHIKKGCELMQHVDTAAYLRKCVEYLNGLPRLDAVLLTGDLIDDGLEQSYDCLADILRKLEAPCFPCVGNHDNREGLARLFGQWVPEMEECEEFVQYSIDRFPLRLVAVDTQAPGNLYGEFCQERAEELDEILGRDTTRPTLVFMHHPPIPLGITKMDEIALREPDGKSLHDVLSAHDSVMHVACGHLHRSIFAMWDGIPLSVAPSPAHALTLNLDTDDFIGFTMEPATCRLFRFKNDQLTAHTAFIGDYGDSYPL